MDQRGYSEAEDRVQRSKYATYFHLSNTRAICKLCEKENASESWSCPRNSSKTTTGMNRHLESKHRVLVDGERVPSDTNTRVLKYLAHHDVSMSMQVLQSNVL